MANPYLEKNFIIQGEQVDFNRKLRLSSFLAMCQNIADIHANELGAGFDDLDRQDAFWVFAKIKIAVNRMPDIYQNVNIKTWPIKSNKLFYLREYILFDRDNNEFLKATSIWVVLNKKDRTISKDEDKIKVQIDYLQERAIDERLRKLKIDENLLTESNLHHEKKVLYSDLDYNVHFNNCKIFELAINCFDIDYLSKNEIEYAQLNFLNEGMYNDNIKIYKCIIEESQKLFHIIAENLSKNNLLFESEIKFK